VWGIGAAVTIVLPYIIPFYILLGILEDSGYLPRAAFLMDNVMHRIGLHGKAFIPLLLGFGCNVPACVGCRIMETDRERFLAGFVVTLIPCAARTVIILGLVGRYLGMAAALALYLFDLALVFLLGRVAFKILPGEPVGLIMEMPPYRMPAVRSILKKTWARTKDFVYVAFPFIVGGSVVLQFLSVTGLISTVADFMSPLTTSWLGLPPIAGIPLVFGVLRKELTLVLLADLAGTFDFSSILTPVQMIVFAIVTMIYIPCVATIAALAREFGARRAAAVAVLDSILAVVVGGLAYHILSFAA
jgi:ferrous iron transport protein B